MARRVTKWEKEKEVIRFYIEDGRFYSYNFNTQGWQGLTGKTLVGRPSLETTGNPELLKVLRLVSYNCEWIFSYPELLKNCSSMYENRFSPDLCSGKYLSEYLKYLKKHNSCVNSATYADFRYEMIFNPYAEKRWFNNVPIHFKRAVISLDKIDRFEDFYKMQVISAKNGENFCMWDERIFRDIFCSRWYEPDLNRGFAYNLKMRKEMENKKESQNIAQVMKEFAPLNGTPVFDLQIIIPKNLKDLQEEGKNQHNCVGTYYNDRIKRGECMCFFLRTMENKSYITCRYDFRYNAIVEFKRKNNMNLSLEDRQKYIPTAEQIVKEFLKKEGI